MSEIAASDTLAAAKGIATHVLCSLVEAAGVRLATLYPEVVRATFSGQEAAARSYAANPATVKPECMALLGAIAAMKGEALAVLVPKIIAKADGFRLAGGALAGAHARLGNAIAAAETTASVIAALDAAKAELTALGAPA